MWGARWQCPDLGTGAGRIGAMDVGAVRRVNGRERRWLVTGGLGRIPKTTAAALKGRPPIAPEWTRTIDLTLIRGVL